MANELYATTDYRRYIASALKRQGQTRREFARAIGRSDAYISLVMNKSRRLDPEVVSDVASFFRLDDDEREYLAALVDLDDKSERARTSAWAVVRARQRHHEVSERLREDITALYNRWYNTAVFELAACDGFRADPGWISATLCPPITEDQAAEALDLLIRLGMLEPDEQGSFKQSETQVWSPSEVPPGVLAEVAAETHRSTLELAAEAIRRFRYNERHIGSLTIAVSEERFQMLLARFAQMELELVDLATRPREEGEDEPNRVYHLAFAMYPLSLFTDTEFDSAPHPPSSEESADVSALTDGTVTQVVDVAPGDETA